MVHWVPVNNETCIVGDCSSLTGIEFLNGDDLLFLDIAEDVEVGRIWFNDMISPISFASLTTAAEQL